MKILLCFGTRPEAIKMAPLYHKLKENKFLEVKICVTAQHREMLDQVLDFFEIKPDYDLNLMQKNQSLNQLSSRILDAIDVVLLDFKPNCVLVHGDTTTSSMVALAAFHRNIKVGHVEAGLRTYDKNSPFPEEMNRQITGRIANLHFAPTMQTAKNLQNEGVKKENIFITGNTVIDALYLGIDKLKKGYSDGDVFLMKKIIDVNKKLILVTGHRRENFGKNFENICQAIKEIAKNEEVQIIYPVHLNPNVQEPVNRIIGHISNVHLIAPIGYPAFIYAMQQAYLVVTDSGGIQEEAPALGKPVVVFRENTERPEAVEAGTVVIVGTQIQAIVEKVNELLQNSNLYAKMSKAQNPYGDGDACAIILENLKKM